MNKITLIAKTASDDITELIGNSFDYSVGDSGVVTSIVIPDFPDDFQIGVIVGSSGSGKTTILRNAFGYNGSQYKWDNSKSIASNFASYNDAVERLGAVGLNSIPSWLKPYNVLSNGERFRADMAIRLQSGAVFDEFTSVVNREVAVSCCVSLERYIRSNGLKKIVFASCHDDILPFLRPDWIYNTDAHEFYSGRYLCRPKVVIDIACCSIEAWDMFKQHHYLSGSINKSCECYLGLYNDIPVAFSAVISMPCGTVSNAFRESRVVVLPDYQGMGIGTKFSEAIASGYVKSGYRFFSKTANPRMGDHRDRSPLWRPTSKNHRDRVDYLNMSVNYHNMLPNALKHAGRVCYSHEYIGGG